MPGGVCNFLSSVSSQQKFEAMDQPYSPWTDCVTTLRQISVTAQFNLENEGKYILKALGHADPKDVKKRGRALPCNRVCVRERAPTWERAEESGRETPGPLAPLFICFFLLPWACPM